MGRLRDTGWLLLLAALLAVSLSTTPAADAQSNFGELADFGGVNGQAWTVLPVGDQLWVGGVFSQAMDADHTTAHSRTNLAVFDFNTGDVLPITLDTNSEVKALETDGARIVWIAGKFTQIAGQSVDYIAAYDMFTGQFDDTFAVSVDFDVNALHYANGWLYIGGEFGQVNGIDYRKMVRVDAATGQPDPGFRPEPASTVRSIDSSGNRVYAAGLFELVGTGADVAERRWIAGFDASTGLPAGPEFPIAGLQPGEGTHKAGLWLLHVTDDGAHIYTGDHRNLLRKWDRQTGELLWEIEAEGDIQAIASEGNVVYGGTHDGLLEKRDGRLLFTLDAATGDVDESFAPSLDSFTGTLDLELSQGALVAVGDFTTIDEASAPHVAVFHGPAWTGATPINPAQPVQGDVSCDAQVKIVDAVLIAQHITGLRTVHACPLGGSGTGMGPGGDVNVDGVISIADAVLVAQCTAGLTNVLCP